jgi:predicted TIM-barrel enzyme
MPASSPSPGFLDGTVRPAIEADRRAGAGYARSTELVRAGRERLLADENASSLSPQRRG